MNTHPDRDPFAADMPSKDLQRARREAMRAGSGGWGLAPLVLGVIFVALVGLMFLTADRTPGPDRTTGVSTNAPGASVTPPTTPPSPGDTPATTPTTPKAQ